MDWLLSALHGQAAFRPAGSMAAPAPPQDLVGAMAQTQDPLSKARRTGSKSGACPQGDRHRPSGLVERRCLAHARRHYQSVTGAMGPPELARSDSGPLAALLNRRVRSRTHGGVGGREGRPSLPPDNSKSLESEQFSACMKFAKWFRLRHQLLKGFHPFRLLNLRADPKLEQAGARTRISPSVLHPLGP